MDEANQAEAGVEEAGDQRPSDALDLSIGADGPPLEPGDSDLADAWWAQ
jgi:hypothetical protein